MKQSVVKNYIHLIFSKFSITNNWFNSVILFPLLYLLTSANEPIKWNLVKAGNNIKVYTASVPNYLAKGIRTEVVFNAPIEKVLKVAMNVNQYPNWIYKCRKSVLVKQISSTELIYYHITDAPWPASDRDQFSSSKVIKNADGSYWMYSHSMPDYGKEFDENVRVKNGKATWHFIPLPNGQTKGEYELFFDPGGYIPSWIINLFIAEGPYLTMVNMQNKVSEN